LFVTLNENNTRECRSAICGNCIALDMQHDKLYRTCDILWKSAAYGRGSEARLDIILFTQTVSSERQSNQVDRSSLRCRRW